MARRDHPGLYCSKRCAQLGKNNTRWKGEDAGYIAQHQRIYTVRGKAAACVWGCQSNHYDWANLTGDYKDIWDFAAMCRECHSSYDHSVKKMFDGTCKRGHTLNDKTMYKRFRNGKEVRQCKQCAKDRAKAGRLNAQEEKASQEESEA